MAKDKSSTKSKSTKGSVLSARTFSGLNPERMKKKSNANFGMRIQIGKGDTVPIQFLTNPDGMEEFDIHSFREDGKWYFVPCAGEGCPLCDDEDANKRRVGYRFVACVFNLKDKKVQILEGPKDLSTRIMYRYERKPANFLKRAFEVTKFNTEPVSYDCVLADEATVATGKLELIDLKKYIDGEIKRYYGDAAVAGSGKKSLKADDGLDENASGTEDDSLSEDAKLTEPELREKLEDLKPSQLRERAISDGMKKGEAKSLDADELIDFIVSKEAVPAKKKKSKAKPAEDKPAKAEKPTKAGAKKAPPRKSAKK